MSKFNEKFIKNYDEDNDKRCILKVDVKYPKSLQLFTFLMKKMKIKKCNKLVCNMYDKNIYVTHIKKHTLKRAVNHGLILNNAQNDSI